MAKKLLTQEEMRMRILAEVSRAGLQDRPENIGFLSGEGVPGQPNWIVRFDGPIMFSPEAKDLGAIIKRLGEEFDIAWQTRH